MVNNIIKRRKELQNAKKKAKAKKNKRKRQRMKKQLAKEQERTSAIKEGDPETWNRLFLVRYESSFVNNTMLMKIVKNCSWPLCIKYIQW